MKKTTLLALGLISASVLGTSAAQAADTTSYPVKAKSDATVVMTEDDGSEGENGNGGGVGPGGGNENGENGGNGGDIEKPGGGEDGENGVVNPEQTSPLRLSLLTAFDFGTIKMSGNNETYYAKMPQPNFVEGGPQERPNFAQVTDNRGNNAGWRLTAKIAEQFTNGSSVLNGSTITLNNGWTEPANAEMTSFAPTAAQNVVLSTDADALVANASADKGMGTWNILYGTLNTTEQDSKGDATKSVSLQIPGSVKKTEGQYTAKIEWTLYNAPQS